MTTKLEFENGSTIETLESGDNSRGKRSKLIGFYCKECRLIHTDYPIENVLWDGDSDNLMMCKESFNKVLKSYMNEERNSDL